MSFNLRGPGNEKLKFLVLLPHGPRESACPHVGAVAARVLDSAGDALAPANKALSPFGMAQSRNQNKNTSICSTDCPYITWNHRRGGTTSPRFELLDISSSTRKSVLPPTAHGKAWQYHVVLGRAAVLRLAGDMSTVLLYCTVICDGSPVGKVST